MKSNCKKLFQRFIGIVYVDGLLFTHPDILMGVSGSSRNKVLKLLRDNVLGTLTTKFINRHNVEFRVHNLITHQVEIIRFIL